MRDTNAIYTMMCKILGINIMSEMNLEILLIGFNRPSLLKKNIKKLIKTTNSQIYISVDGPRKDNSSDEEKCQEIKDYLKDLNRLDRIHINIEQSNLGCKVAVEKAIDWFFSNVKSGIILEDDCVPAENVYDYVKHCMIELKRRNDIFALNLTSFKNSNEKNMICELTKYIHVWGWATTAENWHKYRLDIPTLDTVALRAWAFDRREQHAWRKNFKLVRRGKIDTWDYNLQWFLIKNRKYCVVPPVNFIQNVGFDENATHTKTSPAYLPLIEPVRQSFNPKSLKIEREYNSMTDMKNYKLKFRNLSIFQKLLSKLRMLYSQ